MKIFHWLCVGDDNIQLVDDFKYDNIGPILPDENFAWVDIYGIQHDMKREVPPLMSVDGDNIHYYW